MIKIKNINNGISATETNVTIKGQLDMNIIAPLMQECLIDKK